MAEADLLNSDEHFSHTAVEWKQKFAIRKTTEMQIKVKLIKKLIIIVYICMKELTLMRDKSGANIYFYVAVCQFIKLLRGHM